MDDQDVVWCSRCRAFRTRREFALRTSGKPQCWCRACFREYWKQHYQRHKSYYFAKADAHEDRRRRLIRDAKSVPCADCGRLYPYYVMDFDHRPGEYKLFAVSAAVTSVRRSLEALRAEIAKCDVVCANCHRERTHQRRKCVRQEQGDSAHAE